MTISTNKTGETDTVTTAASSQVVADLSVPGVIDGWATVGRSALAPVRSLKEGLEFRSWVAILSHPGGLDGWIVVRPPLRINSPLWTVAGPLCDPSSPASPSDLR